MREFICEPCSPITALDPRNPVTIGPYMNDPDLINNKYQIKLAMDAAERIIPEVFEEYIGLSGRRYSLLEQYRMEDAEAALFLLNSAAETAKDAVDKLRAQGHKVGVVSPNVIRPFPTEAVRQAFKGVNAVLIGDRADSYGAHGGNMAMEVKAALKDDPGNHTLCIARSIEQYLEKVVTASREPIFSSTAFQWITCRGSGSFAVDPCRKTGPYWRKKLW